MTSAPTPSLAAALDLARAAANDAPPTPPEPGRPRPRRFAIGDPQAPLATFLTVLDRRGLLGPDGWLAPDVYLISAGDHFDWGGAEVRDQAASDGLALLAWLAAHPADQVALVAGNHDLGRVGELAGFDDESFDDAHAQAREAYRDGAPDPTLEAALLARYPDLPTAEVAARDFAAFTARQRDLVTRLLRARRLRLAFAVDDHTLICHAGVTADDLDTAGLDRAAHADAAQVAAALDARLDAALAAWDGGPLAIPGLHTPGHSRTGEGGGILYHRPAHPDVSDKQRIGHGPHRRRYDPRRLPLGLVQIVGHIHDRKCRQLLDSWARVEPPQPGRLRHLLTDGEQVRYQYGLPAPAEAQAQACLVFIDGSMNRTDPNAYELCPLPARA
ncbi:metallophosphoesterase [Haliangium sp.]|uniref:metallophosphoesterase n=1 Tax=Haliangium sp. TaxID=2663208 RepID=UPI003D146656